MEPSTSSGRPVWVDLGTADIDAAQAFYRSVFGWEFHDFPSELGSYITASVDGEPVGGLMAHGPDQVELGVPATWTVFFSTADLEADVARVEAAGGRVIQAPFAIPSGDRLAVVADPVGALLALATFTEVGQGRMRRDELGSVCWVECQSRDVERTIAFYEELFGWSATRSETYTTFEVDGALVGGLLPTPEGVPEEIRSTWFLYWLVDDVGEAATRAEAAGGTRVTETMTIDEGRFIVIGDPGGAVLGLFDNAPSANG